LTHILSRRAVHTTKFSPGAGTQILTTSSDTTVRLFDLAASAPLRTFSSHTDYVRAASFVPSSPSLVFSGGYDSTVRLWDSRVPDNEGSGCVWVGRHGKPVDAVLIGEQGTMAVSAGGPIMRVWDLLGASTSRSGALDGGYDVEGGARAAAQADDVEEDTGTQYCLKALSNHQKAITTLCWAESEQGEKRVLSGGLDGLVKVYDPQENWRVRHTMRYGGQVMSLAVSVRLSLLFLVAPTLSYRKSLLSRLARSQPNNSHLVAGLSDGSLSIRTRAGVGRKAGVPVEKVTPSFDAMLAGMGHGGVVYSGKQAGEGLKATFEGEVKVSKERRRKLTEWDRMLKSFRYGDALDSVMRGDVTPATAFALMDELIRRDGLPIALANRTDLTLEPVLSFLVKHITHPRYSILAADIASVLVGASLSPLSSSVGARRACPDCLAFARSPQTSTRRLSASRPSSTRSSLGCGASSTRSSTSSASSPRSRARSTWSSRAACPSRCGRDEGSEHL